MRGGFRRCGALQGSSGSLEFYSKWGGMALEGSEQGRDVV